MTFSLFWMMFLVVVRYMSATFVFLWIMMNVWEMKEQKKIFFSSITNLRFKRKLLRRWIFSRFLFTDEETRKRKRRERERHTEKKTWLNHYDQNERRRRQRIKRKETSSSTGTYYETGREREREGDYALSFTFHSGHCCWLVFSS